MAGGQKILTLDQLAVGKRAVIKTVGGEGALRRRLLDLGLTPYTPIMVRRIAPLGDPIELYIRGYELALRKSEAKAIEVFYFECSHCGNCYFGTKNKCPGMDKACKIEDRHRNRRGHGKNKEAQEGAPCKQEDMKIGGHCKNRTSGVCGPREEEIDGDK